MDLEGNISPLVKVGKSSSPIEQTSCSRKNGHPDEECGTDPLTPHQGDGNPGVKPLWIFRGDEGASVDSSTVFMARQGIGSRGGEHPADCSK